ncbi:hypothetical protein KBX50_03100 [Micromonospora sp. C51]|uniref:hypothetical protein n=1 Tax=Micromonospora sp. C51 TaxID=2824879 RepID=UPI001B38B228|nr:hypothetical protein [Micromonospora sp. C51]MBQ1047475.1 hypothetical protein [Micromonospora sp. C51]
MTKTIETLEELEMSAIIRRVRDFLRSPRGRQLMERGRQEVSKPSNQRKLREVTARLGKRR